MKSKNKNLPRIAGPYEISLKIQELNRIHPHWRKSVVEP
jgi:hypothetical protein